MENSNQKCNPCHPIYLTADIGNRSSRKLKAETEQADTPPTTDETNINVGSDVAMWVLGLGALYLMRGIVMDFFKIFRRNTTPVKTYQEGNVVGMYMTRYSKDENREGYCSRPSPKRQALPKLEKTERQDFWMPK